MSGPASSKPPSHAASSADDDPPAASGEPSSGERPLPPSSRDRASAQGTKRTAATLTLGALGVVLGRLWDSPAIAILVALAVVAGVDAALGALDPPPEIAWVLDEPAHLITAVLALLALPRGMARPFVASALVAAVAIDLDHLPQYIGWDELTEGAPRPYSHSLVTVGFLVVVAAVASHRGRLIILGAALGVGTHLARDIATGPGIPLLWPLSSSAVTVPHWTYLAGLGLLGTAALRHGRTSARVGMARDRRRRYRRRGG